MDSSLTLKVDLAVLPALEAWAKLATFRGKTLQEALRKVARFAVDFALKKTPRGDRGKIERNLKKLSREYKAVSSETARKRVGSKASQNFRGSVAAAIVFQLNYKQARTAAYARHASFYTIVQQFYSGRQYARNLHAAGFRPAKLELRGQAFGDRLPGFKNEPTGGPGRIVQDWRDDVAEILVENWAEAAEVPGQPAPFGMQGQLGNELDAVIPEQEAQFLKFLSEDLMRMAQRAGVV